jgi:phasin family protein
MHVYLLLIQGTFTLAEAVSFTVNFVEVIMQSFANNPALRSQLETQVNFMTELSQKTYDALRKLMELNLRAAQQAIEDSIEASRQLMSCTDPVQLATTAMNQVQPAAERMRDYQQQLMSVLAGAQVEVARTASRGPNGAQQQAS